MSLSENLISTSYGPSTMLSAEAESEDILIEESDRTNGRLPVLGELVEPFVAVFG